MATTMKLIAKNVLGSEASSVEFASIPGTYTDLLIVGSTRSSFSAWRIAGGHRFNSNATANAYTGRSVYGQGASTFFGSQSVSADFGYSIESTAASGTSNTFASWEMHVPNYAGSTNKSWSTTAVAENNTSTADQATIYAWAGLWSNTAAITSIVFFPGGGSNFVSGSSFFLYGITKA